MPLEPSTDFAQWLHAFRQDGESERAFSRRLGVDQRTLRRIYEGHIVHQNTLLAIAERLNLPSEEVFRHAAGEEDADIMNRSWLIAKLVDILSRLPEADQAIVLAEALRLLERNQNAGSGNS